MRLIKNKRGAELTLNMVIIAALVILVLVFVVAFFLGGFGGLTDTFKETFWKTTSGTDLSLALQNCKSYCQRAESLYDTVPEGQRSAIVGASSYCKQTFRIDKDGDGVADKTSDGENYIEYKCFPGAGNSLDVPCSQEKVIRFCSG